MLQDLEEDGLARMSRLPRRRTAPPGGGKAMLVGVWPEGAVAGDGGCHETRLNFDILVAQEPSSA